MKSFDMYCYWILTRTSWDGESNKSAGTKNVMEERSLLKINQIIMRYTFFIA